MDDVFFSYSRKDEGFVTRLHKALQEMGRVLAIQVNGLYSEGIGKAKK
jgi:hypothetical protein